MSLTDFLENLTTYNINSSGSPYRAALSQAVLKMQETNRLLILKKKWWQQMRGGGACKVLLSICLGNLLIMSCAQQDDGSKASTSAAELGLANVGGIFAVLILGGTGALLISMCEFAWKSRKLALEEVDGTNGSVWKSMGSELKAAMNCSSDTKPVRSHRSESSN